MPSQRQTSCSFQANIPCWGASSATPHTASNRHVPCATSRITKARNTQPVPNVTQCINQRWSLTRQMSRQGPVVPATPRSTLSGKHPRASMPRYFAHSATMTNTATFHIAPSATSRFIRQGSWRNSRGVLIATSTCTNCPEWAPKSRVQNSINFSRRRGINLATGWYPASHIKSNPLEL